MIYTDNTTTGIERIIAQCQDNKIIVLYNYYSTNSWEIVTMQNYQPIHLDGGDGILKIEKFISWLESHDYKIEKD